MEGEISGLGYACSPVKNLSALSYLLRHSKIHLVTQTRVAVSITTENDLREYLIFSQASCLEDEMS
jgi:hypothetical protein